MNGFLFSAQTTRIQIQTTRNPNGVAITAPQMWSVCEEAIVYDTSVAAAKLRFEKWFDFQPESGNPMKTVVKKITSLPIRSQMLTETGDVPVEWSQLYTQVCAEVTADLDFEFEKGNWIDSDAVIPLVTACRDIEAFRQKLPEEISTGLNWSAGKQFTFFISVLNLPPPTVYDPKTNLPVEVKKEKAHEEIHAVESNRLEIDPDGEDFVLPEIPPIPDRATAVIVRARNAAVALWVWSKNAGAAKLANNPYYLSTFPPILWIKPEASDQTNSVAGET